MIWVVPDKIAGRQGKKVGRVGSLIVQAEGLTAQRGARPIQGGAKTTVATGEAFEKRCLRLLETMGYRVSHTGRTGDGGIDLRAEDTTPLRGGDLIIQCKASQAPVGEPVLRDLYSLVVSEGANKGVIMASSEFTESARRFAAEKPLELIDGQTLARMERQYA